ncbi:hypothetical protein C0992_012639 [Termitomyces sp. T32_za158]|nr:hypothetical protein C0992_012639 [Termitomyces sp. T32_za158]
MDFVVRLSFAPPMARNLPEELLERILAHAITPPRPAWLRSPTASTARLAPLLVSRQFHRIATPLLYRAIHLDSPAAATRLLHTLAQRPEYASHIHELTLQSLSRPVTDVLRLCPRLVSLDLALAFDDEDDEGDADLDVFETLTGIRHLTLRKPPNVYLSLAGPRALINALARAIPTWPHLCTANIAFKLSDDTPTSPTLPSASFNPFSLALPAAPAAPPANGNSSGSGPISALAAALAAAPALHTFSTHLPSVWNAAIAAVGSNPALQRISLYPSSSHPHAHAHATAIPGTGLFLMQARRHPRLADLIAAGTPIIRSRAHTLGTPPAAVAAVQHKPVGNGVGLGLGLGLGLRIDTSAEAIGAPSSPRASTAVNPAWMGPVRSPSKARRGL